MFLWMMVVAVALDPTGTLRADGDQTTLLVLLFSGLGWPWVPRPRRVPRSHR